MKNNNDEKSNLLAAYQAAVDLKTYEGTLVWSRYGVMLTIHTGVIAVLGILNNNAKVVSSYESLVIPFMSIIGLVFCYWWYIVTVRGFATNKYWTYSARELEYFINDKKIIQFQKGYEFSQDHEVSFRIGPTEKDVVRFQRPHEASKIKTETCAYYIINTFGLIYESLLLISLYKLVY